MGDFLTVAHFFHFLLLTTSETNKTYDERVPDLRIQWECIPTHQRLATSALTPSISHDMAPHFTIAPPDPYPSSGESGPKVKWAYLSFDYGAKGYRLDLTGNSTTHNTTISVQTDLGTSKPLKLDYDTEFQEYSSNPRHTSVWSWLSGALGLLLVGFIIAFIVRRHKANKVLLQRTSSSLSLPTRRAADAVGVTRAQNGDEDDDDAHPPYTLRAPSPPPTPNRAWNSFYSCSRFRGRDSVFEPPLYLVVIVVVAVLIAFVVGITAAYISR